MYCGFTVKCRLYHVLLSKCINIKMIISLMQSQALFRVLLKWLIFFHMSSCIGKDNLIQDLQDRHPVNLPRFPLAPWGFLSSWLEPSFWPWAWEEQMEGFLRLAHPRVNQVQQMMIQWQSVQNRQEVWQRFHQLYILGAFCFVLLFCKWATTFRFWV